jgi:GLPGLI family protein
MKQFYILACIIFLFFWGNKATAQKIVSDCTVTFSISGNNSLADATKVFYVKGNMTRTDIVGKNYRQSTIYNSTSGLAVILKEVGAEKYLTRLSAEKWSDFNKKYEGMDIVLMEESKVILGYSCKKGIAKLKDGSSFSFFYTPSIIPSSSENKYQFKGIPGFVLEYETTIGKDNQKISFTATKINLNPVPLSTFEVNESNYRLLN